APRGPSLPWPPCRGACRRPLAVTPRSGAKGRGMKLIFVYYAYENQGSSLDLKAYARAAREMGHETTVYGVPSPKIPLNYSVDLSGADAVIFVFEWTTDLLYGDRLDWLRLIQTVPRRRRVLIDCDGRYN